MTRCRRGQRLHAAAPQSPLSDRYSADHCASPLSCRLPPISHRQAVRHEWPILIHATSAAPLSSGSFHPSILKLSGVSCVASVGSEAGSRDSAGAIVVRATPATKSRLSIIIPPLLSILRLISLQ